jgi:hypothetical protein
MLLGLHVLGSSQALLSLLQALVSFFHAEGQGLPLESLRDGSYKVRPRPLGVESSLLSCRCPYS